MQIEEKEYILYHNIENVYNCIFENRKNILEKSDIFIETLKIKEKNKKIVYMLESKKIKIELDFKFYEISSSSTKIIIKAEYKYRNFVSDLFSYLSVNLENILNDYINNIEKKLLV